MELSEQLVTLSSPDEHKTTATLNCVRYTKVDGWKKAAPWGGALFGISILVLPIPIVHFGAIPIFFVAMPLVTLIVYKLYSHGVDLNGSAICPACQAALTLRFSGDYWPVQKFCPECNASLQIENGSVQPTQSLPPSSPGVI